MRSDLVRPRRGRRQLVRFSARGGIVLRSAQIANSLLVVRCTLDGERPALDLTGATVDGILAFRNAALRGDVLLQGTRVKRFRDDERSWPESGSITLDGFE